MRKLDNPPTGYGTMVYSILMNRMEEKGITRQDAADLINAWFEKPEEGEGGGDEGGSRSN